MSRAHFTLPSFGHTNAGHKAIVRFTNENRALSNMFVTKQLHVFDTGWQSSEHAYQASKAVHRRDFDMIHRASTPYSTKKLGREIEVRPDWDKVKYAIMQEIVLAKFSQDPDLRHFLINTNPLPLIEGNTWSDRYWGMTLNDQGQWVGHNHLGFILMNTRTRLLFEASMTVSE